MPFQPDTGGGVYTPPRPGVPRKKRRVAGDEAMASFRAGERASWNTPPGLAGYQAARTQAEPLPWLARPTPTGETMADWLARRYETAMGSWSLDRAPFSLIHDLATASLDERRLGLLLERTAPLQEEVTRRLAEQRALGAYRAGERAPLPPTPVEPDRSLSGYESRRASTAGPPPGSLKFGQVDDQTAGEQNRLMTMNRAAALGELAGPQAAEAFPTASAVVEEAFRDRRGRLRHGTWLANYLTTAPADDLGEDAARKQLRTFARTSPSLSEQERGALTAMLDDHLHPLDIAGWFTAYEAFDGEELHQRGIPSLDEVMARIAENQDPGLLGKATGGVAGRAHQDLLGFAPRDELEADRLAVSHTHGLSQGGFHPGKLFTPLDWAWQHVVSRPLGFAGQYLVPLAEVLNSVKVNPPGARGPLVRGGPQGAVTVEGAPWRGFPSISDAWHRAQVRGLGGTLAEIAGVDPADPHFGQASALFELGAAWYADPILVGSRVGAGARAARRIPAGEAVTGASLPSRATRILDAGPPDLPKSRVAQLTYQVMAQTPESLASTPGALKAFRAMAEETSAAVLADRFRLPGPMAARIADERDPERIRDLFVAGFRGSVPGFELYEIDARLAHNTDEIERLKGVDQTPEVRDKVSALTRQQGDLLRDRDAAPTGFEVRTVPELTLLGKWRQEVKRAVPEPARRIATPREGALLPVRYTRTEGTTLADVLFRSGEGAQARVLGKLPDDAKAALATVDGHLERTRTRLGELYGERTARPGVFDQQIGDLERNLSTLEGERAGLLERNGLSRQHALWQARDQFGARNPLMRTLSWAYNRKAGMRAAFEMLPRSGDAISITDKTQGVTVLERLGQALDVDRKTLDAAIDHYLRATGPTDTKAAVALVVKRAKTLHPEYSNEILRMWGDNSESLYWAGDFDGAERWMSRKPWMGDQVPFGQAHITSELVNEIPLPDWRAARDLRRLPVRARNRLQDVAKGDLEDSTVAAVAERFGVRPGHLAKVARLGAGGVAVVPKTWLATTRAVNLLMTNVWTPAVLLRGGWPMRVVGEEQVRMAAAGLASSVFHPGEWMRAMASEGDFARFADVPDEVMVAYTRHLFDRAPKPMKVRKGMPGYTQAWRGELRQLAGAPEIRFYAEAMAAHGEGEEAVAATVRWLRGHPDGQEAWKHMQLSVEAVLHPESKRLAREAATAEELDRYRQEWVRTFADRLRDKTRGDQTLLGMIREGELRQPLDDYLAARYGGDLPQRTQLLVEQARSLASAGKRIPHELRLELEGALNVNVYTRRGGKGLGVRVGLSDEELPRYLDALPDAAKPNFVKGRGFAWHGMPTPTGGVINTMFDYLGGKPTSYLSRAPAYRQFAAGEFRRLRGLGVPAERAESLASEWAVRQTKMLLYELGERSSLAQQLRGMMPFVNAWQEVAQRWLVDLPAKHGGFGLGQAALARRGQLMFDAAEESGLIFKNDRGEWATRFPGLDALASHVLGVPMRTDVALRNFNIFGNGAPGLSPITLAALTQLPTIREQFSKPGPLKATFDWLTPFGPEVQLGPAWMGRAWWGLTKQAPPWELFSSRYQQTLWDGAIIDGMRVIDAKEAKDSGTGTLARIGRMQEGPEKTAAFSAFLREAESMGRHFYLLRAGTGVLLPAQPSYYWPNAKEAAGFFERLNAIPKDSPERKQAYDDFIEAHPELSSYLVGKSTTDPEVPRPTDPKGGFSLKVYWEQVRSGARERLTPEQWETFAAGAVDYQQIQHDYRVGVAEAGSTAAERLANYGAVIEAGNARAAQIGRLRQANPTWAVQFDLQLGDSARAKGEGRETFEQSVAADFANNVKVISDLVNDSPLEDEIDFAALREVRRTLFDKYGTRFFSTTGSGVDAEVRDYFDTVLNPYLDKLDGIYAQAHSVPKAERGPLYEAARKLKNEFAAPEGMPGPEAVLFGMGDREQQDRQVKKWASNPPSWLTDFQRQKAGLQTDGRTRDYWDIVNANDDQVRAYIREHHLAPSSREATAIREGFQQWTWQLAKANGLDQEWQRENEWAPFARAYAQQQLPGDDWANVAHAYQQVQQALAAVSTNKDGRPAGIDSRAGRPIFDAFVSWLDLYRQQSPSFDEALDDWGRIIGTADEPLIGEDLYRRFIFGSFR